MMEITQEVTVTADDMDVVAHVRDDMGYYVFEELSDLLDYVEESNLVIPNDTPSLEMLGDYIMPSVHDCLDYLASNGMLDDALSALENMYKGGA